MSRDVLQDYLDELLGASSTHSGESQDQARAIPPTPTAQPVPRAPVVEPRSQLLDDSERRDQLQQLLYSAHACVAQHTEPVSMSLAPALRTSQIEPEPKPQDLASVPQAPSEINLPESQTALDEALLWHENGRPGWAQEPFEVLLFTVSGLNLAVPLITLGQIQPLTDKLTPLFGQADWFMGLLPTSSGKIRTVNTAKFVMPERYDPSFVDTAQYVISINGVPWGLAVDKIEQPMKLAPEDVKWRGSRSKRAWLAGTVKQHMCALLDIPMMAKLLTDADRNSRK